MEKEFVPYEVAVRLKSLGFDESCFATYLKSEFLGYPEVTLCLYSKENIELGNTKNSNCWISLPECCSAPTFSQAFRFFRDNLKDSAIEPYSMVSHISYNKRITFEEAEIICVTELIKIVESKSE